MSPPPAKPIARLVALAVIAAVLIGALVIVGVGRSNYEIVAQFRDAGQLVKGGQVRVGGMTVGRISSITLSPNGLADVRLKITDGDIKPLHAGTRARIRAVGQAGVANRFVELLPGAHGARPLRSGSPLPPTQTTGIVDLDAILSTLDAKTRHDLRGLLSHSAQMFAGSSAATFHRVLVKLEPALGDIDGVAGQLSADNAQLGRMIRSSARAAAAVNSRPGDLAAIAGNTARSLGALARERAALNQALLQLPATLESGGRTLGHVSQAATALRPALLDVAAVAPAVDTLLTRANTSLPQVTPAVARLNGEVPGLARSLRAFKTLGPATARAFPKLGHALDVASPILEATRIYGVDLVLGIFNGLIGISSGGYDATGHYVKLSFIQNLSALFQGTGAQALSGKPLVPGLFNSRVNLTARCPGGQEPPSKDGSSPWIPDPSLCDPADNVPASVNQP